MTIAATATTTTRKHLVLCFSTTGTSAWRVQRHLHQKRWSTRKVSTTSSTQSSSSSPTTSYSWPSVYEEARDMMKAAYISYPISFLIREAKRGNLKDSPKVLQTLQTLRDGDLKGLRPHEILHIVSESKDYIGTHPQNNFDDPYGWYAILKDWERLERLYPNSLELLEFDDHFDAHRLVYGIIVNKLQKRITVIFRGTYADYTDDWKRNLQFDQVELPVPFNLRHIIDDDNYHHHHYRSNSTNSTTATRGSSNENNNTTTASSTTTSTSTTAATTTSTTMRVHEGMYNYLFDNTDRGPKYDEERYEEIIQHIEQCINKYPDFKVYVTGHSAGGALAKLFAFYLATSRLHRWNIRMPKPVTVVCFGSLCLGNLGFQRAFQLTEQLGWIRHLRIINEGDPVCYLPPLADYAPSGMHLQLHRNEGHILWYPNGPGNNNWSSIFNVLRTSIAGRTDLFTDHLVQSYLRRIEREREELSKVTMKDLYQRSHLLPTTEN